MQSRARAKRVRMSHDAAAAEKVRNKLMRIIFEYRCAQNKAINEIRKTFSYPFSCTCPFSLRSPLNRLIIPLKRKMNNAFYKRQDSNASSSSSSSEESCSPEDTLVNMKHNAKQTIQGASATTSTYQTTVNDVNNMKEAIDNESKTHETKQIKRSSSHTSVRFNESILMKAAPFDQDKINSIQRVREVSTADRDQISRRRQQQRRNELDLYTRVRVLLGVLEKRSPKLRQQALQAVRVCNRRYQDGRVGRQSLPEHIDSTLRLMVGEQNWRLACDIQRRVERHNRRTAEKAKSQKDCGRAA